MWGIGRPRALHEKGERTKAGYLLLPASSLFAPSCLPRLTHNLDLTYPASVFILDSRALWRITILVKHVPMSRVAPEKGTKEETSVSCSMGKQTARESPENPP